MAWWDQGVGLEYLQGLGMDSGRAQSLMPGEMGGMPQDLLKKRWLMNLGMGMMQPRQGGVMMQPPQMMLRPPSLLQTELPYKRRGLLSR